MPLIVLAHQEVYWRDRCCQICPIFYSCRLELQHIRRKLLRRCRNNFPRYWKKGEWPANSPDLNPIENLWSILADNLDKLGQVNSLESLIRNLKLAWSGIDCDINLVSGMPNRIEKVLELKGDYIGK